MVPEELITSLPFFTSDDLLSLAYDLRSQGFSIDARHCINVQRIDGLLLALESDGDRVEPERLKTILAPVFCSTPQEQAKFYTYFDTWLEKNRQVRKKCAETGDFAQTVRDPRRRSGSFLSRCKWLFFGLVAMVLVLTIRGDFGSPEPAKLPTGNILQGILSDFATSLPISGAQLNYLNRTAQTGSSGYFRLEEFSADTAGDLMISAPHYLAKVSPGIHTKTLEDSQYFELYGLLEDSQSVTVTVIDANSSAPLNGAKVLFLASTNLSNDSGKIRFRYQQVDSTAAFEVSRDGYVDNSQPYELHGFGGAEITIALEEKTTPEADSLKALIDRINHAEIGSSDPWRQFYKKHYRKLLIGGILLPFLFLFASILLRWYRKPLVLERETTNDIPG